MKRVKTYVNCVSDANQRAGHLYMAICDKYNQFSFEKGVEESSIFQWTQMWGSTTCGFEGFGGAAMTNADCVVVEFSCMYSTYLDLACVYHNGRFAYSCKITDEYKEMVKKRIMPGQGDVKRSKLELIDVYNREDVEKMKDGSYGRKGG